MFTWLKTHYKQIAVLVLSFACYAVIHYRPQYRDAVLLVVAALGGVGLQLVPFSYGGAPAGLPDQKSPKAPSPPPFPLLLVLCLLVPVVLGPVYACNAAKDAKFAADLIRCIDEHADLEPAQVAAVCAVQETPDFINLLTERKLAKSQQKPCVIITVDAGPSRGPGL